ncbi:MAG: methyltransferase [Desulfobacterales bacterium]|nr:methyltransferase [Desulfobacterales bacterium]MCP4160998.1 methyltransferase [Deltaproteobacteria bacterium]
MEEIFFKSISDMVLEFICNSEQKRTYVDIEKNIRKKTDFKRLLIKKAINNLIKNNEISYTYQFGNTYLEISYNKPVRIGQRVVLIPENRSFKSKSNDIVVKLQKGASFGTGAHPTTRLCLKGLEFIFDINREFIHGLDMGTGSGVLAIAAKLMGTRKVYATDIHEVAASEARKNISINNIENDIEVSLKNPDELGTKFSLIMANLRYPTLKELYKTFRKISEQKSFLVLSGIREPEADEIIYKYKNYELLKRWDEGGWSGLVMVLAS